MARKRTKLDGIVQPTRKMTREQLEQERNRRRASGRIPVRKFESGPRSNRRRRAVDEGLAHV